MLVLASSTREVVLVVLSNKNKKIGRRFEELKIRQIEPEEGVPSNLYCTPHPGKKRQWIASYKREAVQTIGVAPI